jgi:methyl-accepting chemotaxis protein
MEYREPMTVRMTQYLADEKPVADLAFAYDRVERATIMNRLGYEFWLEMVLGLYTGDFTHLDASVKTSADLREQAVKLRDDSVQQVNKDRLQVIIDAIDACSDSLATLRANTLTGQANRQKMMDQRTAALSGISRLVETLEVLTSEFTDNALSTVNRSWRISMIGASLATLIALILAGLLVRSVVGPLTSVIDVLSDGAGEVHQTAEEMSTASQKVAETATLNASSLEQTGLAVDQLASMTKSNSDNAQEASRLTVMASEAAKTSTESMEQVNEAMSRIAESGNEIDKIIKTIDEIAFQTNLLALNAAVEAARAGEAGAGFAVVADEVRNLAIRSAEAAKSTATLIAKTIDNIKLGSSLVRKTSEGFGVLSQDVQKVAEIINDVSSASEQQTQGIHLIKKAVAEMDQLTQSNASVSKETSNASLSLSQSAVVLDENVSRLVGLIKGAR